MKTSFYLVVNSRGAVRCVKNGTRLDYDEISILTSLVLPDALFNKPKLIATITVPDEAAKSEIIETVVADNVQQAIEHATGLTFSISIVEPVKDEDHT